VNFRESADLVKKTAQERGYTAPVLLDASGDVARATGALPPPATSSALWSRRRPASRRANHLDNDLDPPCRKRKAPATPLHRAARQGRRVFLPPGETEELYTVQVGGMVRAA
jgi:hypothetical protein